MKQYDYMIIEAVDPLFDAALSAIGSDGWELRSALVVRGRAKKFHYIFTREKVEELTPETSAPPQRSRRSKRKAG